MDHRVLFAIDKNDKKWVGKTYEVEHKTSLCWVRKLEEKEYHARHPIVN